MAGLRERTFRAAIWTVVEKFGVQGVGFGVTIVLSRLLTPGDYGVVGMLGVFLAFSQMFIDSGFSNALIRKRGRTEADFSTVFWFNLAVAGVCYGVLFAGAPLIAAFYHREVLVGVLRVMGLSLVVNALYTVQVTRLTALLNFMLQAKVSLVSACCAGAVGIGMALGGCGVWALVGHTFAFGIAATIGYWGFSGWRPGFVFSCDSFRELFGFGSKLLTSSFLHTVYVNLAPLIIGRSFSAADLGFFTRGESMASFPGGMFTSTVGRVVFPILASIQDDAVRLRAAYRKYMVLALVFGVVSMGALVAVARPLVGWLLGAAWLPCVPYLQLLALAWMLDPVTQVALNALYVKGRSDVVLKLEVVKKIVAIALTLATLPFGIIWLCVGRVGYAFFATVLNVLAARAVARGEESR